MAANNYYGFTHGGTQYTAPGGGAPAAQGYQANQAAYSAGQTYAAQPQRAPAAAAYETYQPNHSAAATYTYPARQEAAPAAPAAGNQSYGYARSATTGYEGSKSYYQTQQAAPAAQKPAAQAAKNAAAYSTPTAYNTNPRQPAPKPAAVQSYNYNTTNNQANTGNGFKSNYTAPAKAPAGPNPGNSSYDAALYNAASSYVQQQQPGNANRNPKWGGGGGGGFKKGPGGPQQGPGGPGGPRQQLQQQNKPKLPPKPPQLHYCEVCKISCAGPQTFREHLDGQKHKKKEVASKIATTASPVVAAAAVKPPPNSLRCELCDVACTGADAYAAHIRGAKHQKVVKLHTRLGKAIPSADPVVPPAAKEAAPKTATPKITFVGGSQLATGAAADNKPTDDKGELAMDSSDVQPVGQDFIEEVSDGKTISFLCKLCDCRFNDPNAKEMHMKGRRHRLQYKKKVNPELFVDVKPSLRQKKIQEDKQRRMQVKEDFFRRREEDMSSRLMEDEERIYWEERRRFEEEMEYFEWYRRYGQDPRSIHPPPRPFGGRPLGGPSPMMVMRRPSTSDDRHVTAKHTQIYPSNEELQAVQKIVSNTEKALKIVSDQFAEADGPKVKPDAVKPEPMKVDPVPADGEKDALDDASKDDNSGDNQRILKGVMRVGVLAKGLLLRGDLHVQLVVLCSEKPTRTLLNRVADSLPKQLAAVTTEEKYDIKKWVEKAAIVVTATVEPKVTITITLTSPLVRDTPAEGQPADSVSVKDPPDVLDKQKCLEALAALRHAKWFQARAAGLQSCVMITRILRDLCQRIPTWTPLNSWAMELLTEKVISSAGQPLSPGDALRRILEAVASGLLLPAGPGLLDPCEKDPLDSTTGMTNQEREDITASAQHALRLVTFRQIHKVLGMDPLPVPPKPQWGRFTRKRRRDNSTGEGTEEGDGKKDKKDDGDKMETEAVPAAVKA